MYSINKEWEVLVECHGKWIPKGDALVCMAFILSYDVMTLKDLFCASLDQNKPMAVILDCEEASIEILLRLLRMLARPLGANSLLEPITFIHTGEVWP